MRYYVGLWADDDKTYLCYGHINSFNVGLGKTTTAFGLFQTPHLIGIACRMVIKDKAAGQRAHNPDRASLGAEYPSNNPVGFEYPCLHGSQAVSRGMGEVRGTFLYMTTPTVYLSARKEALRYFALAEDAADFGPYPPIQSGGCYAKDKERMRHDELDEIRAVSHNVTTIPRSSKQKAIDLLNADGKGEYDLGEYWVDYDADGEGVIYVVFASNKSGGPSSLGNADFGTRAEVTKQGNVKPVSVTVPWVVKRSRVAVNKYDKARSFRTLLMSAMRRVLVHGPRSETKVLPISATALSTSWKSSLKGLVKCTSAAGQDSSRHSCTGFHIAI
jgi:hypothetical protein